MIELQETDVERRHNQGTAENADDVGEHRQQRDDQHRRNQPRQDEKVNGVDPESIDRVHFLVDFLRADLGGERRPGASGKHDRRHERPELAQHGNADAIDDKDHRAELLGDKPDLECDDHAHKEARQQDDRDRIGSGLGRDIEDIAPVNRAAAPESLAKRRGACAEEPGHLLRIRNEIRRRVAHVLQHTHSPSAASRCDEVFGVVGMNQGSEVRGELADLYLCIRGTLAPNEIEEQRDAYVVDIAKPRGIDDNRTIGVLD